MRLLFRSDAIWGGTRARDRFLGPSCRIFFGGRFFPLGWMIGEERMRLGGRVVLVKWMESWKEKISALLIGQIGGFFFFLEKIGGKSEVAFSVLYR